MSDQIAFPLLAAVFIFGSFLSYYMSSMAHEKSDKIAIGVKDGVPIPLSYRWVLLCMMFIPWGVSAAAASIFVVLESLLMIAPNVASDAGRLTAYWVALMHAGVVFTWFTMGPLHVIYYRSVLRKAEADQPHLRP